MVNDSLGHSRMVLALGSAEGRLKEGSPLAGALKSTKSNIEQALASQPVVTVQLKGNLHIVHGKSAVK